MKFFILAFLVSTSTFAVQCEEELVSNLASFELAIKGAHNFHSYTGGNRVVTGRDLEQYIRDVEPELALIERHHVRVFKEVLFLVCGVDRFDVEPYFKK